MGECVQLRAKLSVDGSETRVEEGRPIHRITGSRDDSDIYTWLQPPDASPAIRQLHFASDAPEDITLLFKREGRIFEFNPSDQTKPEAWAEANLEVTDETGIFGGRP